MDAIRAITERVSVAQLTGPDITQEQKEVLFKAAMRAPDHAWMRPSRYLTIEGEAREELGKIFYKYQAGREVLSPEKAKKVKNMLLRAPLVIVGITHLEEHPKVPRDEQLLSTGAGVQNMLNAAYAMGLGAIWRTGAMAECEGVRKALGLRPDDVITAFLYVGHINTTPKPVPEVDLSEYVSAWTGEIS
ncbi:MAG: nitroreductase [Oceanospirillaceae bacterium]|jgi:nitroreductase|uniref:nitroreductase family protein n=1 Tax=unclassified Thalassolituus TaxID=2624967 RepID=UPI000B6D8C2C|nr:MULTISPECIES: nitroreductase [unclassified Thalassolituus]MAE35106.1 nitroreductase [Oceanospirillaceae bacterium]OUX64755.1 MAG: hypothetical protein CBE36_07050 [Oceanospirillaceae bacterium TMED276]MBN59533.1 nitroreductase [Oceanospirillaceae bacterium]MDQ4424078.1 nitroreductase [Thalassolituus sp.]MDQ4427201.1 nitroreductase [Thalassolituus sp.]|tara:strand:- start:235 stop:801 length:567 start_codon:yes stop_codon:yes gene_type:complete